MNSNAPKYLALIKPIPPPTNLSNIASLTPSTPCTRCSTLLPPGRLILTPSPTPPTPYKLTDHYPSFPFLKVSSKACSVCKFLRKTIRSQWAIRPMEEWHSGPLREGDEMWDELLHMSWDREVKIGRAEWTVDERSGMVTSLSLEFGPVTTTVRGDGGEDVEYGQIGQVISYKVFDSKDMSAEPPENGRRLPSLHSLSNDNLQMIDKLIHDCKTTHPQCSFHPESPWLPTRLLDVAPEDPRLVDTTKEQVAGPYVALSHMWGSPTQAPPLRTLTSNIDQMSSGIEMWKLPKNFAEAVIVTRRLGIRYVWIDSLYIIQDSGADWQREAKTMHQVYKFAEITVVATSATRSHDGFLARDLSTIPAVKYSYPSPSTPSKQETLILSASNNAMDGTWATDVEGIPWNRRGWTMQERSLSMRLLHFSSTKLYFECRTCIRSEENEPLSTKYSRPFEMWPVNEEWMAPGSGMTYEQEDAMYGRWRRAVSEYSVRGLTKGTDKLTAIASVAAEMGTVMVKDGYVVFAGMWRKKLGIELLWHVRDGVASRPWEHRAPSWSWASLDAKIGWHERRITEKAGHEVLREAELEVRESVAVGDGAVENVLRVKGVLKPVSSIRECDNDERWVYGTRGNFPHDVYTLTEKSALEPSLNKLSPNSAALGDTKSATKFLEVRLDLDDKDALTRSSKILGYVHINSGYRPSGLLVEKVPNTKGNVLKRVGVATAFDKDGIIYCEGAFCRNDEVGELLII